MQMRFRTLPTQGPKRTGVGMSGKRWTSSFRKRDNASGDRNSPLKSGMAPDKSRTRSASSMSPGFSAPLGPNRTNRMCLYRLNQPALRGNIEDDAVGVLEFPLEVHVIL